MIGGQPVNYYKVLGIEENATQEEIKEAYNRQVQTFKEEVKDEKEINKLIEELQIVKEKLGVQTNGCKRIKGRRKQKKKCK